MITDLTRVCRFRATSDIPATSDPHEVDYGPVAAAPPVMLPTDR